MSGFSGSGKNLTNRTGSQQVASSIGTQIALSGAAARFVQKVGASPRPKVTGPRFLVSFDATGSREATWSVAQKIQGELFPLMATSGVTPLVRLTHFGGSGFSATKWTDDVSYLQTYMKQVGCVGGMTQIERVLDDATGQARQEKIAAVIYTGDSMEERHETLCGKAEALKSLGVPVYMFQEGEDADAERTYKQIAKITGGAYAKFTAGAFNDMRSLFKVVVAVRSNNQTLIAAVRDDKSLTGPARMLLADLSKK